MGSKIVNNILIKVSNVIRSLLLSKVRNKVRSKNAAEKKSVIKITHGTKLGDKVENIFGSKCWSKTWK